MMKMTKNLLLGIAAVCGSTFQAVACTGISLTSRDGSYVQARTIECCLLYTSPSPRDGLLSRMPSSA